MDTALSGRHVPPAAAQTILGSLGGALGVAARTGGATGALLARAARAAFMSGLEVSLAIGALVALIGAALVLARLPSLDLRDLPEPPELPDLPPLSLDEAPVEITVPPATSDPVPAHHPV